MLPTFYKYKKLNIEHRTSNIERRTVKGNKLWLCFDSWHVLKRLNKKMIKV